MQYCNIAMHSASQSLIQHTLERRKIMKKIFLTWISQRSFYLQITFCGQVTHIYKFYCHFRSLRLIITHSHTDALTHTSTEMNRVSGVMKRNYQQLVFIFIECAQSAHARDAEKRKSVVKSANAQGNAWYRLSTSTHSHKTDSIEKCNCETTVVHMDVDQKCASQTRTQQKKTCRCSWNVHDAKV